MQGTNRIVLISGAALLAVAIGVGIALLQGAMQERVAEPELFVTLADPVEELTDGTTSRDIEQDLVVLADTERSMVEELNRLTQEIEQELELLQL